MDNEMIDCMTEAGLDTIEIRLRRRMEDLLSEGKIEAAEDVEEAIKHLDTVPLCELSDTDKAVIGADFFSRRYKKPIQDIRGRMMGYEGLF